LPLSTDIDEDRRGLSDQKGPTLPNNRAVALPKRHHGLSFAASAEDDGVLIGERIAGVAGLDGGPNESRRSPEFLDKVVRPDQSAGGFGERVNLLIGAGGENASADDEWRCMRSRAIPEVERRGRILMLAFRAMTGFLWFVKSSDEGTRCNSIDVIAISVKYRD